MKEISTKDAPQAIGPYSQAIEANGFIFTSGQIALKPDGTLESGDIEHQTHQVMKNLYYVLEAAGAHFNDVVKTTIFLANMNDFEKVNEVYAHYFGLHKPARSTVAVKTLPKNVLVEIECIALAGANYTY
ncbi:RidA family protein [Sulfurovum sp. zt1-1]|uniref:RidA family protein n=1 Tax=Sulfurovum zhangzhouensis TaxID=3019067 RepID=A0ABT7QWA2_9BACT|nr:RidA family protein [Sulfurovum zhangzhouensis]MDM5271107.1 RidA family protein [Sulfurovum zhangzhouensis]